MFLFVKLKKCKDKNVMLEQKVWRTIPNLFFSKQKRYICIDVNFRFKNWRKWCCQCENRFQRHLFGFFDNRDTIVFKQEKVLVTKCQQFETILKVTNERYLNLEQTLKESKINEEHLRTNLIDLSTPCERCMENVAEKQDRKCDFDMMTIFEDLKNKVSKDWHEFKSIIVCLTWRWMY